MQLPRATRLVVRIAGARMYLWRAVDHEGEILDMLVQRRRDSRAALRLMRKLLKKQGFAPKLLVTDKLRSYVAAFRQLGLGCPHEQGLRRNNRAENSHQLVRDASANCNVSSRLDPPSAFSVYRPLFTTPSTFSATSSPDPHCGSSEPKLPRSGTALSQRHNAPWRVLALNACSLTLP